MGRPKLTEAQRREARERIAQAALDLYAEGGLKAASIRAIAKRLDVAPSWLYLHYSSHYDLLTAVWRDRLSATLAEMQAFAAGEPDPVARLRGLLERYARFGIANPVIYRNAFMIMERPEDMPDPRPPSALIPWFELLRDAVAEAQERGRAEAGDPATIAEALWGALHGAIGIPANLPRFTFGADDRRVEALLRLLLARFGQ